LLPDMVLYLVFSFSPMCLLKNFMLQNRLKLRSVGLRFNGTAETMLCAFVQLNSTLSEVSLNTSEGSINTRSGTVRSGNPTWV